MSEMFVSQLLRLIPFDVRWRHCSAFLRAPIGFGTRQRHT
jgi:hypothetical protein